MTRFSVEQRAIIRYLHNRGVTAYAIAADPAIHSSTRSVSRHIQTFQGRPDLEDEPRSGRPLVFDERTQRRLRRLIESGQYDNAEELLADRHLLRLPDTSVDTIRRALRRSGLVARKKLRRPRLTDEHRLRRLEWAHAHEGWTVDDWHRVLWSDEAKMSRTNGAVSEWVWRVPDTTNIEERCVIATVQGGGGHVFVWGCMTAEGVGSLFLIEGRLNAERYKAIMRDRMRGSMIRFFGNERAGIFQHDNDRKHTSHLVQNYLRRRRITVLPWPSQSPDMNPIEHLWADVKRRLRAREPFANLNAVWEALQGVWNETDADLCRRLVDSMPERVQAVIAARGGHTRF